MDKFTRNLLFVAIPASVGLYCFIAYAEKDVLEKSFSGVKEKRYIFRSTNEVEVQEYKKEVPGPWVGEGRSTLYTFKKDSTFMTALEGDKANAERILYQNMPDMNKAECGHADSLRRAALTKQGISVE